MREIIGVRLKEERERLGLSQTDFAALGEASKRSQIEWEQGRLVPKSEFLALVATHGVDVSYVLTGTRLAGVLSGDDAEMLSAFRALDARGKDGVFGAIIGMGLTSNAKSSQAQGDQTARQEFQRELRLLKQFRKLTENGKALVESTAHSLVQPPDIGDGQD